ncbi:MAG: hormogonium polysaccharide biosynthesis glycosyltransferase HpsE [Cyanobacteria bacterium J06560_2]
MVDFTVAIPTYNSGPHLHKILDALTAQTGLAEISWEVIVADNNSSDETADVVTQYQAKWPNTSRLRYLFEPTQGAGFARNQSVKAANSELVGFVDDDVLPAPDWVACAYQFGLKHPHIGLFSGQIHGNFSSPLPEGFQRIQGFLAVREHGTQAYQFKPSQLSMPTGAAFVTRKTAWTQNVPDQPTFIGRVGSSMVGGEDLEPMLLIHKAGWETWYAPTMHAYHQIPGWRLEKDYLANLIYACALCTCQLKILARSDWPSKALVIPRLLLGNSKRLVGHLMTYRQKVFTETVPACELAFLVGNLVSPFYFFKMAAIAQLPTKTAASKPAETPSPALTQQP